MAGRGAGRGRAAVSIASGSDASPTSGRGRGRGSVVSSPLLPRAPTTLSDVVSEIQKIRASESEPLPPILIHKCVSFTRGSGTNEQLVQTIFEAVYDNRERAEPLAILSSTLSSDGDNLIGKPFRNALLSHSQSQYNQRKELRLRSVEVWLCMISFLSYLFKYLKAGGQPIRALSGPLSVCFSDILSGDDISDDEIDCVCDLLRNVGSAIAQSSSEQDVQLIKLVRDKILASSTSNRARCLLLELLEFRAAGWTGKEEANRFYADTLGDMH